MNSIIIDVISHKSQRYDTVGDWFYQDGKIVIRVSEMTDWRYEFLVALHELVEMALCKQAGISQETVDQFDTDYENNRKPGDESEPGDHPNAPYRKQHFVATNVERQIAHELGVDWGGGYESELESL